MSDVLLEGGGAGGRGATLQNQSFFQKYPMQDTLTCLLNVIVAVAVAIAIAIAVISKTAWHT